MSNSEASQSFIMRVARLFLSASLCLFPILFLLFWYSPIVNIPIRAATVIFGILTVFGLLFAVRKKQWIFTTLSSLCVIVLIFLALPTRPPQHRVELRTAYINAMRSYLNCPYMWGGEGRFGIDCSGLMRRGLEDALVRQGLVGFNPLLIRQGLSLWWHDTTAREMGRGYKGRTRLIATCPSLNEFDHSQLQPGDMAVTTSGVHVMAYLGNGQWIAADPSPGKVVTFTIPEKENSYFSTPMNLVRWRILEDP